MITVYSRGRNKRFQLLKVNLIVAREPDNPTFDGVVLDRDVGQVWPIKDVALSRIRTTTKADTLALLLMVSKCYEDYITILRDKAAN
jgi:hypothetical protein